ncbi:hypothetical protein [Streptococcus pneumoniae]|uniref:hypothetical protein n=1 Tax=Streptococcus pneumoniae TaxID=1313 RepID=UPI00099252E8|nr:hypothetical protein [Streptococcus pneumoniae]
MMSKQFLFYDIEIYFILYHAFFILSDNSLLPYLLPYIEKSHQMMTFQREQKTVPVICHIMNQKN